MGYSDTTGFILFWNPYQPFVVHRSHHVWYDEYHSRLSIEDKNTPGSLLLQKVPEIHVHNSDILNSIPCELDLTSYPFSDTQIITYKIELPTSGKKIGFNLLDDEDLQYLA